jgi:hypothetical protein
VDGSALKVFKYTLSGSALGSWKIDPANTHPTGITINPNNVSDIWIVDNGTDKVYQYVGAAGRTSGSQNAGATFALAAANTNPQGIADPPTGDLLLTPVATPTPPNQPRVAAVSAVSAIGPPAVAGVASLAHRDAAFALLAGESLPGPGEPFVALLASGALTPGLGGPTPPEDGAGTAAATSGGQKPLDVATSLTLESSQGLRSERNGAGLLQGSWLDEPRQTAAAATDSFISGMAQDAAAEE